MAPCGVTSHLSLKPSTNKSQWHLQKYTYIIKTKKPGQVSHMGLGGRLSSNTPNVHTQLYQEILNVVFWLADMQDNWDSQDLEKEEDSVVNIVTTHLWVF